MTRSPGKAAVAAALLPFLFAPTAAFAGACSLTTFTLPVTMQDMRASVPVDVNGQPTRFWLDSGAWFSIMSQAKAEELGLKLNPAPYGLTMEGIGGSFIPQVTNIKDFGVNGSQLHNVDFLVGGSDAGNGLIGRNILTQSDTEFDLPHGLVKIARVKGCGKVPMAYWAPGKPYFTARLMPDSGQGKIRSLSLPVTLGTADVVAAIDTGAMTILSRRAAERAGIDLKGPAALPVDGISGFGRRYENGWLVEVPKLSIGDETILNAKLTVIDGPISGGNDSPDMLLGIDFLLAHHVYVSREQHRIFFTYTGGNPFPVEPGLRDQVEAALDKAKKASAASGGAPSTGGPKIPEGMERVAAIDAAADPTTADEFARRASARLAHGDNTGAIADFDEAIRLSPATSDYYRQRAEAHGRQGEPAAARADFDKAITLAPNDAKLLLQRAWQRHAEGDETGALADAASAQRLTPPASLDVVYIANLYEKMGKAADAIHLYDPVIAAHGDDARLPSLLNARCWARALADTELDDALADCKKALHLTGNAPAIMDSRALVLFRKKDFAGALDDYGKVLKATPKAAWSLYMQGLTRIALGQAAAGKVDCDTALKLDPGVAERAKRYAIGSGG